MIGKEFSVQMCLVIIVQSYKGHLAELQTSYVARNLSNKSPGVRRIGIGEASRRLMGKAVMSVVKKEVAQAAGPLQVCTGQVADVKLAIHSMVDFFESDNSAAEPQMDASIAFNSLNRSIFLHNIKAICPKISNFVVNFYTLLSGLFLRGKVELKSKEGTTQGSPIANDLYALGITALESMHYSSSNPFYNAGFVDDFTGCEICRFGPFVGYYVNPTKKWLIVNLLMPGDNKEVTHT